MHVDLHCQGCDRWFSHSSSEESDVLEQLQAEGPWFALGDGETPEDRIFAAVKEEIRCPECGVAAGLSEEDLGRLSLQLLDQW
jgi:hypothetical protein